MHYEQFQNGTVKCIENEIPFETPESWAWARLRTISFDLSYGTSKKSSSNGKIAVLRMGNLQNGEIDYSDLVYSSDEEDIKKYYLIKGDLLFNRTNSIELVGKTSVYRGDIPAIYAGYLIRIRSSLNHEYLNAVMNSNYAREYCTSVRTDAVNQSNINAAKLGHFLIAIPSKSEQKRISEKISESIKIINIIEQEKIDLQTIATNVKSKILDLAIRGKLVPQDPNDEPAYVLLERIQAEKEELLKQGKIKRDKKESVIFKGDDNSYYEKIGESVTCIDDRLPFEIPNNWCWARLSSIAINYDNYRKPVNLTERKKRVEDKKEDILYPYFGATGQVGFIDDYLFDGVYVLLGEDAAPFLDKTAQKAYIVSGKIWVNNHVHILESLISSEYLLHCLNSIDYLNYVYGTTRLKLSQENMNKILLPIPPIKEQIKLCQIISTMNSFIKSIEASS